MSTRDAVRASPAPGATSQLTGIRRRHLAVGASDDPLEMEADRVADRVLAGAPVAIGRAAGHIQRRATQAASRSDGVPASVRQTLAAPGIPLAPPLRHDMERRFGHDFSRVRVHSDPCAEQSARDIGAHAYTSGSEIVFGSGRYAPQSHEGRRLLAHELTHVLQQASGRAVGHIQAQAHGTSADRPRGTPFRVNVDRELDAQGLRREFVKQYYGATTEAQIQSKLSIWDIPARGTKPTDVARGFVMLNLITISQTDFDSLDPKQKEAVNQETDRRFWEKTGYKPGQKLGTSAKDQEMAEVWKGTRNAVLTEDKQRKEIDALPQDIKAVLFAGDAKADTLSPDQYTEALRIANKLAALTPAARKDYLERVNAFTTSLSLLEGSIDSYIEFQKQRERQRTENETTAKPLFGAEAVYDRYRLYKVFLKDVTLGADATQADQDLADQIKRSQTNALLADLKVKGFDSIESFEAALEAYRIAFRTQAVNLALDVLARYEHMLFEERQKLQQPGAGSAIAQGIAGSKASAKYKEYHEQEGIEQNLQMGHEPKETWWIKPAREARLAAAAAHSEAESEVVRGSGNDPLVAERGTDREKLAGLDAAATSSYLIATLNQRETDTQSARQEFHDDPDRVFKLPDLVAASLQTQGIGPDTVYGKLIADHIKDEKARHLLSQIAIGILAVALAFLVPGGGWLAAAALVANAGLSIYQAHVAYKEYEEQERDYRLHFLSEEPSLFWVGLAIAAAAIDLGAATTAIVKQSATALKALEPSLMAFSKDGDLATLASKIDAAEGLDKAVKASMKREAAASLAGEQAMKEFAGRTYGMLPGFADPGAVKQAFRAFYYSIKRGINTIARLRGDAKYMKALGDITQMSGAERAELEAAFEEVKELVKVGQAKNMDEATLLNYVDRWAINRNNPGFKPKLLDEMRVWKPLTEEQQHALHALNAQKATVTTLYEQKAAALEELAQLRAKASKTAEDLADIRALEKDLTELDPKSIPQRAPPPGAMNGLPRGKIAEAEATLAQREAEAAKAELTLYDRLRAAAPSEAAKERALKGITADQVGVVKTKPTGLHIDHIVSVNEISDMEGFNKLLWKDQKAIVDMKENLIAMDGAANLSKGDRTWRSWSQAGNFYEKATIDGMLKREAEVRRLILDEIKDRLAKLETAKP